MPNESHVDPETLERGRYRVLSTPDGGLVILRSTALCDRCHACTCGDKQEPIGPIPANAAEALRLAGQGDIKGAIQLMMKGGFLPMAMMRNGRRG